MTTGVVCKLASNTQITTVTDVSHAVLPLSHVVLAGL